MTAPVRVAVSVRPHRSRVDTAPAMPLEGPLVDRYGRVHDDLRISVTDRCNLRCVYCMPEEGLSFLRMDQLLTFDEITRVARVARGLGVKALRITGGEPLVRRGLPALIARFGRGRLRGSGGDHQWDRAGRRGREAGLGRSATSEREL